jgi:hypothetical protein
LIGLINMNLLPATLTHDGRALRQPKRIAKTAIYQLINDKGLSFGFKVIQIRVQKEREIFGRIFKERKVYPADSQFGSIAWSFGRDHRSQAFERFEMLARYESNGLTANATQKVLATEFRHGGRLFTQLKRNGRVALYKLSGAGYEVVIVQKQKAREIPGYTFPECEVMPTLYQWGTYGWSYLAEDLAGAERRYQGLLAKWGDQQCAAVEVEDTREETGLAAGFLTEAMSCC